MENHSHLVVAAESAGRFADMVLRNGARRGLSEEAGTGWIPDETVDMQFAKEQLTWFKSDGRILWLDPCKDYFQEACRRVREWQENEPPAPGEAEARP